MRNHVETATILAATLTEHASVSRVYYPGLADHAGHDIAKRQQSGFGGMLSFEIDGDRGTVRRFIENLNLFSLAESLGGVESLVCHPATMTHAPLSGDALKQAGITQNLIRLSVGLESSEDLVADVIGALNASVCAQPLKAVAIGGK